MCPEKDSSSKLERIYSIFQNVKKKKKSKLTDKD